MKRVNWMTDKHLDVNRRLKAFNTWFDEFILVAAKPLAMLGFAMGTVDIFVRGTLATQYWFAFSWAAVQGLTIDGLFFTVWWRIFAARWEPGHRLATVGLVFIGVVLGIVATLTNSILGLQQLWGYRDSQQAMVRLGIDPFWFSIGRAVLVVTVSTMVAYVTYKSTNAEKSHAEEEAVTVASQPSQITVTPVTPLQLTSGGNRERVWQALDQRTLTGTPINLREVAGELDLSYDVVRKWASKRP